MRLYAVTEMRVSEIQAGHLGIYWQVFANKEHAINLKKFIDENNQFDVNVRFGVPVGTPKYNVNIYELDMWNIQLIS